jgi:redox-sensitive bicupin YhaK (pirin superfamily)
MTTLDTVPIPTAGKAPSGRRVVQRTRGHRHGPVTRLISPSDLGGLLRPFVFLDHFDIDANGASRGGFGLHPHSGIATITWILEGSVGYEDTSGQTGEIAQGGLEYMQAGGGAWHGGHFGDSPRTRGFQLWVALPPEGELGQAASIHLAPHLIERDGPAAVLLGHSGMARSTIQPPSPINYLSVKLKAEERWRYQPPEGQTVAWLAVSTGRLIAPDAISSGELAVFEESDAAIDFHAQTDTELVLGSAFKHPHDLVLGNYSVHTSIAALREGEARIREIRPRRRREPHASSSPSMAEGTRLS